MGKFDKFYEAPENADLNRKILLNAQAELKLNKKINKQKIWLTFLVPAMSLAIFAIAFKFIINKNENQNFVRNTDQVVLVAELSDYLNENDEFIDMVDELSVLQDIEYIEQIEVNDA